MSHRNPPPKLVGARWGDRPWENRSSGPLIRVKEQWGDEVFDREVRAPFNARFAIEGGMLAPLWHATTRTREIIRDGFRLDRKGGLGGSSTGTAISFTQSLPFACMIASCLLDAIRLADGRMSPQDVLERARREGDERLVEKTLWWYEIHARSRGKPDAERLDGLDGERRIDATWWLYNSYLRARCELRLDYDPGFFNVRWASFRGLDESNVGVLECAVVGAVWSPDSPLADEPTTGLVTYHGWERPPFAPDQDEYRAYDMSSIRVLGLANCS